MPPITLAVCAYKERDLLERLLRQCAGCYDELLLVHDGSESSEVYAGSPEPIDYAVGEVRPVDGGYRIPEGRPVAQGIQALVYEHGGHYFEGPRCFQQEPHWPFAWSQARSDWILRLDADEFPSAELKRWLHEFRAMAQTPNASGFTCFWPLWNGRRAVTQRWPAGRSFLFNRQRVRFFGMAEQVPIPDDPFQELNLVLHHQPKRASYGVRNTLVRRQAFYWRRVIAESLAGKPTDLPRWRWSSETWPAPWKSVREHPLLHSVKTLIRYPLQEIRSMMRAGERPILLAALNSGLNHGMLGLQVFLEMRRRKVSAP